MFTIIQCVNNLDVGGAEQIVLALASALKKRGFRSEICCIEDRGALAENAEAGGISVHALNLSQVGKLAAFRNFCALLRSIRQPSACHRSSDLRPLTSSPCPVIIHSHNFKPFYYSSLARMTGAADGHIHTRHGAFIQQHKALWRYRLLRRGVNKIVSVSVDGREELAKLSGLPVEQIGVVANGVDTEKYKPAVSTQRSAVSDPTIITVARLSPEKDLATLLRAFRLVLDRWGKRPACPSTSADNQAEFDETRSSANGYPTMPLVRMAGSAVRSEATTDSGAPSRRALPQLILVGDGPERSSLEALAQDLNLGNQIKFLGVRNDIPNLLQAADVFALSSISEGLSMALIEAAAYGLPIVATDVGGNAEIVNAPHGGRLVPARNPEAIAVALADVLGDDASRQAMGTAARQHAVANFSLEQMVTTYLKLYDELQIRRGTSPR